MQYCLIYKVFLNETNGNSKKIIICIKCFFESEPGPDSIGKNFQTWTWPALTTTSNYKFWTHRKSYFPNPYGKKNAQSKKNEACLICNQSTSNRQKLFFFLFKNRCFLIFKNTCLFDVNALINDSEKYLLSRNYIDHTAHVLIAIKRIITSIYSCHLSFQLLYTRSTTRVHRV